MNFLLVFLLCVQYSSGLYFHIGETERKCFIEEIPDETTVLGNFVFKHDGLNIQVLTYIVSLYAQFFFSIFS